LVHLINMHADMSPQYNKLPFYIMGESVRFVVLSHCSPTNITQGSILLTHHLTNHLLPRL
jgi:hypothetical protein